MTTEKVKIKAPLLKRILRIFLIVVFCFLLLLVAVILLIQTAPVQNYLKDKAVGYLQSKIHSKVEIGRIEIGFPKSVVLLNVFLEDQQHDTLISIGKLSVELGMWKLLHSQVAVNDLHLEQATVKIKRRLPDTTFNFQYIIDAFSTKVEKKPADTKSSSTEISVESIELDKIRLLYDDVLTGNDLNIDLSHLVLKINRFDLKNQDYGIPLIQVSGLHGSFIQRKPLLETVDPVSDKPSLQLALKKISLQDIRIDYGNEAGAFNLQLGLETLLLKARRFDLARKIIDLDELSLSKTEASIHLGKKSSVKLPGPRQEQAQQSSDSSNWRITVSQLALDSNHIVFNDDNQAQQTKSMDYSHFNVSLLSVHAKKVVYNQDSISASLSKTEFSEKNDFRLLALKGNFLYSRNQAFFQNLELKTAGSSLVSSISIRYPSIESLKKNPGALVLDLDIRNSRLLMKDILFFAPDLAKQPIFSDPARAFSMNAKLKGKVSDLKINQLQLTGLRDTHIDISGSILGLPELKMLKADLSIRMLSSTRADILSLIPSKSLPSSLSLPEKWSLRGTLKGGMADLLADLNLKSTDGNLQVKGGFRNLNDPKNLAYNASISTDNLNVGAILPAQTDLGEVTMEFKAEGKGFDPNRADAQLNGLIHSFSFKKYTYQNADFKVTLRNKSATADIAIRDSNLNLSLTASADLSSKYPAIKLEATIDSIRTEPLHFTTDKIAYHGVIHADFPQTDPDQLKGELVVEQSVLVRGGQKISLDTIRLSSGKKDSGQFINLYTDFFQASLQGHYKLTEISPVFRQIIEPYFTTVSKDSMIRTAPYHFTISASVLNKPVLKTLLPDLDRLDPVSITGNFDSEKGWQADLKSPRIEYAGNRIENLQLHAKPDAKSLTIVTSLQQFSSGKRFSFFNTSLTTRIADNKIDFALNIQDKSSKDKYHVGGLLQRKDPAEYLFSIHPEKLLLNYQNWAIAQDNLIRFSQGSVGATHFDLKKGSEELKINSQSAEKNAPLELEFNKFLLSTLTDFAGSDSSLANGELSGKLILEHTDTKTSFTSDLTIQNLSVYGDTVGNIALKVNHTVENTFSANLLVSGRGNDLELKGDYVMNTGESHLDLDLEIRKLQLESAVGFSFGALKSASGSVNGKFTVQGSLGKPSINGNLAFDQAIFVPAASKSRFSIDKESLQINNNGVKFNHFTILDSSKNNLVLDGDLRTEDFKLYKFNLSLSAKHFQALSSTKRDNKLYYGQFYFNADLAIKGTNLQPSVDGSIRVDKKTKLTILLPQGEPGVEDRAGIVEFVDMKSPGRDSVLNSSYDSIGKSPLKGFDISTNIEIDSTAEINLIIDESNGDNLVAKGSATLTGSVDRSGKTSLTGTYQLSHGSYDLSFSLLHRRFDIQNGSTITWTGEPAKAKLNIDAVYIANAPPIDLVQDQISGSSASVQNTYQQKLPFEVHLKMKGDLLKPEITFDIVLPDDKAYSVSKDMVTTVQTKLDILRQEEGEINKQVFALLILGRFISDDPFSSASNGANAESIARASVSKLLSQQLNQIASNLIHGVDINFDLQSTDDYTTGQLENRTDLNASISKRLLNDRLTVTVGSDFELQGPQNVNANTQSNSLAGNIALGYKLSKDGRYLLRAYRKNDYDDVVEGYVVETGVGFVITVDYDHFKEIFESKKKKALAQEAKK